MKTKLRRIATSVLRMSVGACYGYAAIMPLAKTADSTDRWLLATGPLFILLIFVNFLGGFIVSVALHELGHVVAGKLAGFRFAFMIFWPVQIHKSGEKALRIRFRTRTGLGLGGLAGMVPQAGSDFRKAYMKMIAGGPLASLLSFCVFTSVAISLGLGRNLIGSVLWNIGLTSLLLFVSSILPRKTAGYLSDGAILQLMRWGDEKAVQRYLVLFEMASKIASGTRPAAIAPEGLTVLADLEPAEPSFFNARHLAFLHAADTGNLAAARGFINEIQQNLAQAPLLFRSKYNLDEAWLLAREGHTEKARELLKVNQNGLVEPCEIRLVEAEIALAEGKPEDARRIALESLALIDQSMTPSAHAFARHRIKQIII